MTFRNLKSPLGMTCEAVNTTKHFKSVFPHRSVNLLSREIKGTMLVSLESLREYTNSIFFFLFHITKHSQQGNIISYAIIHKTYAELILDFKIDFWLLLKNSFLVITNLIWLNYFLSFSRRLSQVPWLISSETLKIELISSNKFYGFSFD